MGNKKGHKKRDEKETRGKPIQKHKETEFQEAFKSNEN